MTDEYKYHKYKQKYLQLKRQLMDKYPFFINHSTKSPDSLMRILKLGKIRLGTQVRKKDRVLSGGEAQPYIFTSMYFPDLKNYNMVPSTVLILSSHVLNDYDAYFNKNWLYRPVSGSIKFDKNDDVSIKKDKLETAREFIKNPIELPLRLQQSDPFRHHELVFTEPLKIKKYLRGIVCYGCSEETIDEIREVLRKKKYGDVKIFNTNIPDYEILDT